ncbi:uncharacterized protein [Atheta coriaria]|uniref:uncharacterized protein n=1 Tax=Dalotia coriaria TaxID=877792 RepID=UPI0031F3F8A9
MIARSPSRRRRASRSGGSSPQPVRSTRVPTSPAVSPGRRASIAVSPVDSERIQRHMLAPEMMSRSPRHSIIPDISLESRSNSSTEDIDVPIARSHSPRNSLVPDSSRSPRHSLVPGDYSRSPRNSLVPDGHYNRSPRNSLVPEVSKSPRHSLVPDQTSMSRSPRHSLVPDGNGSRLNLDFNRSPRNSLLPDGTREARNSRLNEDQMNWGSGSPDEIVNMNRSPRHSIVPDGNRSPRGSIAVDRDRTDRTSPRGSIANEYIDRSPRGSIAGDGRNHREPLSSLNKNNKFDRSNDMLDRNDRSPRGSLTLTFQDPPSKYPRRYSTDYGQKGRSASPYRSSRGNLNQGYNQSQTTCNESGSRRASSSVSQNYGDGEAGLGIGLTLTTYGSVAYQLKDANLEANDTCDFIFKALQIFNKTVVVTVVLVFLSTLPLLMLIMGAQFLRDCPREQYIPIYMLVGGTVGCLKMAWILWDQLYTRRLAAAGATNSSNIGSRILSLALTIFLLVWFALGNYWILRIKWPDYAPTLFEPNRWCHRTLYVFAIVHLFIIYAIAGVVVLLVIILAGCQAFGCPWLGPAGSYK